MNSLQKLLELHFDRVQAYNRWDESFRIYLVDEQERVYDVYVQKTIADFNTINQSCLALVLDDEGRDIRTRLLALEQQKLKLWVEMQLLQKAHFIDRVKAEREEEELLNADKAGSNILEPVHHHHHHDHDHDHDAPLTLATKRQPRQSDAYDNKKRLLQKQISENVEAINDLIDEIRFAINEENL